MIEAAARYGIAMDAHEPVHEPVKDTGERRTWPNTMTCEWARGQEYYAGGGGNPPEHETILFFTRLLAGPMDFTPGIFDLTLARSVTGPRAPEQSRPRTTLAKQLVLYVVLYSPLQMAADLPEGDAGQPAFLFVRYVAEVYADGPGADWRDRPTAVAISRRLVDAGTVLRVALAPGRGQAVRIRPAGPA